MKISNLKRTKDGIVRVEFSDGTALRVSDGTVLSLGLCRDRELNDVEYAALKEQAGHDGFKMAGLRMASGRLISRREAEKKLKEKGCPEEKAGEIALWLESLGLINDELLAKDLVRHYRNKGYGDMGVRRELGRRVIPKDVQEQALMDVPAEENALEQFVSARLKGKTPDKKELQRVAGALARRGHGWGEIKDALRRYEQDLEEDF